MFFLPIRQRLFYFQQSWKILSCTPDKNICVFHLYLQILSHPHCHTQDRLKIMRINTLVVLEFTYLRRQVTLVFTAVTSKNGVTFRQPSDAEQ